MKIAVIGAGPIGVEAALAARRSGHDVVLYDRGATGRAVSSWGHIQLFTPWHMNTTEEGRRHVKLGSLEDCPTGEQFVAQYLRPLGRLLETREQHQLVSMTRDRLRKDQAIGARARQGRPFRLLFDTPAGEQVHIADAVFDCTGVLDGPNPAGAGGMVAPGERALAAAGLVAYGVESTARLHGEHIAVIGAGATGTTVACALAASGKTITWISSGDIPGFVAPEDDPLPQRRALMLAGQQLDAVTCAHACVASMDAREPGVALLLEDGTQVACDGVAVCTGFRPDLQLSRELQVHMCYASEGPMKLAAALLSSSGSGGDCLQQVAHGPETLVSPEPGYFVLGAKSYGRRNDFLLTVGHQQIHDALSLLG